MLSCGTNKVTRKRSVDTMVMNIFLNGVPKGSIDGPLNQICFDLQDAVHDEIRGYLVYQNSCWNFVGVNQYLAYPHNEHYQKLALILESPHKDEYSDGYIPLRPANGRTGSNINKKLSNRSFAYKLDTRFDYQVLIMNPIQIQCSCYHQFTNKGIPCTASNTRKVFRFLFNAKKCNLRADFILRLKKYNPNFVLNCSTSSLKPIIETAIQNALSHKSNAQDIHPSVW